jgi:RNA polymerase sigma-70 factor (ECF subfamily)
MGRQRNKKREASEFDITDAHREYVFAVAMRYLKDHDAAADVAQDALLRAHRKRRSFRGDAKLTTWLYSIASTTALMHLRKAKRLRREVSVPFDPDQLERESYLEMSSAAPSPERLLDAREQVHLARQHLAALGDKYEHIFMLRYGEGHTETEIAAKLGLTVPTVKSRAHRARQAVRQALLEQTEQSRAA